MIIHNYVASVPTVLNKNRSVTFFINYGLSILTIFLGVFSHSTKKLAKQQKI